MRVFRKLHFLIFLSLLAGCDQKAFLNKFVPKDDDASARRFLDAVRRGDFARADGMLDATLRGAKSARGLRDLNAVLAHGEPVSVEVIGVGVFGITSSRDSRQTTNLSYQIHFRDTWAAGNVALGHKSGAVSVLGAHFQTIPDSLEVLNRFTFAGKSPLHYLVFALCIAVPVFILVVLVICIRSPIRWKWLWIIFILPGLVQFQFGWISGRLNVQPISLLVLGANAFRPSPYAPWTLGFAIPVGAIIFLATRRRLLLQDTTPEA
ncbi:MAG TPA: hypothetical protein VGG02_03225 [Chthoniobacterales bacterium]|jgi:hypothetical protein